jgi:hypothetical protein
MTIQYFIDKRKPTNSGLGGVTWLLHVMIFPGLGLIVIERCKSKEGAKL